MTLMQLIKLVLDEAYKEILGTDAEKDTEIKASLSKLQASYAALLKEGREVIDYSSPQARFANIYKYTVAHSDYIRQLIAGSTPLKAIFESEEASVACLGGGPGSDLLGILKHMINSESTSTLTVYLFDRERAWGDSWSEVAKPLKAGFPLYPVFQQFDVTDRTSWTSYRKYLHADLFTLSYFMSEVWSFKEGAAPFFRHCFERAKPGAFFLFIDNDDYLGRFAGWSDELANENGVELLRSSRVEMSFAVDEEKRDLEPYYSKFGWPKRTSKVAYRVGRKQEESP